MRSIRNCVVAGMFAVSALTSLPTQASAHGHHGYHREAYYGDEDEGERRYREYRHNYYQGPSPKAYDCRTSGTTGLIAGGALGALVGRGIDRHGDRATGTILGAGGGALIGREIDRKHRC